MCAVQDHLHAAGADNEEKMEYQAPENTTAVYEEVMSQIYDNFLAKDIPCVLACPTRCSFPGCTFMCAVQDHFHAVELHACGATAWWGYDCVTCQKSNAMPFVCRTLCGKAA